MKFRVFRRFFWVQQPMTMHTPLGVPGAFDLHHEDRLQMMVRGEWRDVPLVQGRQPDHPGEVSERKDAKRGAQRLRKAISGVRYD